MKLRAVVKNPVNIARHLAAAGEMTEVEPLARPRSESRVLRRQALGDEGREAWPWATTAGTTAARATGQRNERKGKRGLHRGLRSLRATSAMGRMPVGGSTPTRLRAAEADRPSAAAALGT